VAVALGSSGAYDPAVAGSAELTTDLEAGRAAFARHEWADAIEAYERVAGTVAWR
jgi:hypothetical protein